MTDSTRLATYDGSLGKQAQAKAHDYPLYGFDLTWRDGAYRVSIPNLLKEGERLHVVPAFALTNRECELRGQIGGLCDRITELEEALAEALDYVPDYFREKWKLDDPLKKGAKDA